MRPRGATFVSYSYKDKTALDTLEGLVSRQGRCWRNVELHPFPPIRTNPSEMVSNELISSINTCESFIYIDTPSSRASRWVVLETDYARRTRKPVFRFDPASGALVRDKSKPLDLAVFPSFHRADRGEVKKFLDFMKTARFFDVFDAAEEIGLGDNFEEVIRHGMTSRLERGGFTVLFWTQSAAKSVWVQREVQYTAERCPKQILVVLLGDVSLPDFLADRIPVKVHRTSASEFDLRDVDNVIVWLQWLIQSVQRGYSG